MWIKVKIANYDLSFCKNVINSRLMQQRRQKACVFGKGLTVCELGKCASNVISDKANK